MSASAGRSFSQRWQPAAVIFYRGPVLHSRSLRITREGFAPPCTGCRSSERGRGK